MKRNEIFWKLKLMAFLHDPPCKCFDIRGHEAKAKSFLGSAGIDEEEFRLFGKVCDATASAADRFPFPDSRKSGLRSSFDGSEKEPFKHPLGGAEFSVPNPLPSADLAEELFQTSIGGVHRELSWKEKFFLYWRRWPEESAKHDERLAYLPADTRIPDHTIWTHMSMTSALQGCINPESKTINAAFLMFQFGPIQEFITTARSTRDLLSGSYLLSWLSAHAMKAVADVCGPDSMVSPSLRGQPIFDVLDREELYQSIKYGDDTLWKRMNYTEEQLLSPTLPNRFLAIVPAEEAVEIAEIAACALNKAWEDICDDCWDEFSKLAEDKGISTESSWRKRWDGQTRNYWKVTWQTWSWRNDVPMDENLSKLHELATRIVPEDHRDARFVKNRDVKKPLNNIGFLYQSQYKQVSSLLAMRRNTREFDQFFTDGYDDAGRPLASQSGTPKDALSGKEEIIGSESLWHALRDEKGIFKNKEGPYGAIQIIKRIFMRDKHVESSLSQESPVSSKQEQHLGYLSSKLGLKKLPKLFDSVEDVAKKNEDDSPYVAVIAMDGDCMGQFISGEKTPEFKKQLSNGAAAYFEKLNGFDEMNVKRALSPSYHLQFSEALSNFATHLAGRTVNAFGGQLIYAGGDDVLAMLPADKALACAVALRACFRGESPPVLREAPDLAYVFKDFSESFDFSTPGWVRPLNVKEAYPLLVPGPNTDVSCGIAIAHKHYPLQSMIRAAQSAEKRAKNDFGRAAISVSLLKRGGETIHWGCKWNGDRQVPLALYHRFMSLRRSQNITGRFAYSLSELLKPYSLEKNGFVDGLNVKELIAKELETPLERQCKDNTTRTEMRNLCLAYLDELEKTYIDKEDIEDYRNTHNNEDPSVAWGDFPKLFLTAAFIDRKRKEA